MGRPRRGYVLIAVLGALAAATAAAGAYAVAARRGVTQASAEIARARAQYAARGAAIQAAKNVAVGLGAVAGLAGPGRGVSGAAAATQIPGLPQFPAEMSGAGGLLGKIAQKMQEMERLTAERRGRDLDTRPEARPDPASRGGLGRPPAEPLPILRTGSLAMSVGGSQSRIVVECETGKLNINTATRRTLERLMGDLAGDAGVGSALVNSIEAYKISLAREGSVDRLIEPGMGIDRPLLGARLDRLEALLNAPGVTPELYERMVPHLTAVGSEHTVDPNYATPEVWMALGVRDASAVNRLGEAQRRLVRLDRATLRELLGAIVFDSVEGYLSMGLTPVFTVRAVAEVDGAVGRHMIRVSVETETRRVRALESREGWL
jgi:hypothetical protein